MKDLELLNQVQTAIEKFQSDHFPSHSPGFFALELCGECGELANIEKKLIRGTLPLPDKDKLSEEAADVFISLINYCVARDINLAKSVNLKILELKERAVSRRSNQGHQPSSLGIR